MNSNTILSTLVIRVLNFVKAIVGCQWATIAYTADCGFPKKSGLDNVKKFVVIKSAHLNYDYGAAVARRAEKETGHPVTFTPQPRKWGQVLQGYENKILEHKGKHYLIFFVEKGTTKTEVTYMENGQPCNAQRLAEIQAYLATKSAPKLVGTQAAVGLTDKQVEERTLAVENIHYITANGQTLTLSPTPLQEVG